MRRGGVGRPWWRALALAAMLAAGLPEIASAQRASSAAEAYTFAFRDAEVAQVAQEVLGAAGVPFAVDPGVTGKITFRIEQRLTRDQLLAAFEAVLEANGIALVRNGETLIVTPQAKAKSSAVVRRRGEPSPGAGYEVVAVPLAYAEPSEVAKALEAISSASSVIYTSDRLGLLVLGGNGQQLKTTLETLRIFDQSGFEDSKIRWFELSQAQATTVSAELERIVAGAKLVGVNIVPLRRLNGVIVFGRSAESLAEVARWVQRLDTPGKEAASSLWVYRPRATSAESLSKTLNTLLGFQNSTEISSGAAGGLSPPPVGAPAQPVASSTTVSQSLSLGDEQVRIGVDKDTNTLIVFASPGRWQQIQRILTEIDRTPRQVLIEASILEVTLSKDFQFGVDWAVFSGDFAISSINNNSGNVGPSAPGLSITFLGDDIEAAVSALGARTAVEVISAPKIIALDNRTARLQIGDQVPVVTQSSQSRNDSDAALINTVDYRSTGVILTVTPRVTGEDQLTLEVSQEVSSVARTVTSGIDSPTIQQRRFESALVLHDGAVVALGGLISSNRSTSNSGVPGLKDVPGIGALFSSRSNNSGRSELIVLLTARIIRDRASGEAAMGRLRDDMRELQARGLLPADR
jgi:general secretion pathway protein D